MFETIIVDSDFFLEISYINEQNSISNQGYWIIKENFFKFIDEDIGYSYVYLRHVFFTSLIQLSLFTLNQGLSKHQKISSIPVPKVLQSNEGT